MLRLVGLKPARPQIQLQCRRIDLKRCDRWQNPMINTRTFAIKAFLHNKDELINKSLKVEEEAKKFLSKHQIDVPKQTSFPAADKLMSQIKTKQMKGRYNAYEKQMREAEEEEAQDEEHLDEEEQREFQERKEKSIIPVKLVKIISIIAYLQRNITSWSNLQLDSAVFSRLSQLGFNTPTDVQKEAIQYIAQGADVVVQSQTGTGKTFVFLLPLLSKIKTRDEPYQCLILAPSRELAVQIGDELMKVAAIPHEKASSLFQILVGGNELLEKQVAAVVDHKPKFVIGTPGRIQELLQSNSIKFLKLIEHFKYLVLDEADKILQPPSRYETRKEKLNRWRHPPVGTVIFQDFVRKNPNCQLVCTSATVNNPLRNYLKYWWPRQHYFVKSGDGFAVPPNISHFLIAPKGTAKVVDVEKIDQLVALFYSQRMTSLLVFISGQTKIINFVDKLKAKGVVAVALHTAMTVYEPEKRGKMLELFKRGEIQMIVATDETVRGLDFDWIENVAVMNVPKEANTYLHIAGRTGRLGRLGKVFVFAEEDEMKKLNAIGSYLGIKWTPIEDI